MARKARSHPKPARQKTYLREWRKREPFPLSLDKVSERLEVEFSLECSVSQLSRIERGEQPYSQDLLEALAEIYKTEPASLIMRKPSEADAIYSIVDSLSPPERIQALAVLTALAKAAT